MKKGNQLLKALQILEKYGEIELSTDHDTIYFGPNCTPTEGDWTALYDLGCHWDDILDSWYLFT